MFELAGKYLVISHNECTETPFNSFYSTHCTVETVNGHNFGMRQKILKVQSVKSQTHWINITTNTNVVCKILQCSILRMTTCNFLISVGSKVKGHFNYFVSGLCLWLQIAVYEYWHDTSSLCTGQKSERSNTSRNCVWDLNWFLISNLISMISKLQKSLNCVGNTFNVKSTQLIE